MQDPMSIGAEGRHAEIRQVQGNIGCVLPRPLLTTKDIPRLTMHDELTRNQIISILFIDR
jgi:hypothetical protein